MLLSTGNEIMDDQSWLYDIKWDGWRILLHKEGNKMEAFTRHGNVVTNKFPELLEVAKQIRSHSAILDCEGVVLKNGIPSFEDFAYRGSLTDTVKIQKALKEKPATFIAFDLLTSTHSHIQEPLIDRKNRLHEIVTPSNSLINTPYIIGEGNHLFQLTKERKMEGIVGKRTDSAYEINTRTNNWLKFKHFKYINAVIMGYKENPFTLIVGVYVSNKLKPVASLEFGIKPEEKEAFRKIAPSLIQFERQGIKWLDIALCCTVQYLDKTERDHLRIASFKGFQFKVSPDDCKLK